MSSNVPWGQKLRDIFTPKHQELSTGPSQPKNSEAASTLLQKTSAVQLADDPREGEKDDEKDRAKLFEGGNHVCHEPRTELEQTPQFYPGTCNLQLMATF